MKHIRVTYCLLFVVLFACELESLQIEVEQAETRLVISSNISPGNPMLITVTRSFSALEGNEDTLQADFLDKILVKNAGVIVTSENQTVQLQMIDEVPGIYFSQELLDADAKMLNLNVLDSTTGLSITAMTEVMERVNISEVRFLQKIDSQDTSHAVVFEFVDPPEANWYVINVFDPGKYISDFSENPFGIVNGEDNGVIYDGLLSDETFNEPIYRDTINFFKPISADTLIFFFSNISEGHFRFLNSQQRTGGILSSATGEPINHPTNVIGGYGYFSAHDPTFNLAIKED